MDKKLLNLIKCLTILYFNIKIINCTLSGLYVDNGYEQSVLDRSLSIEDKEIVEKEILELLGLPERPRNSKSHMSLRKSAPKFLLDVYRHLLKEEDDDDVEVGRSGNRTKRDISHLNSILSDADEKAIDQSDIIMTYLNKNHHVSEVRHERGRRLWFDVANVTSDTTLMMAELRIYQNPMLGKWQDVKKDFTITVYSIINMEGQNELEILASKNTSSDYHGWIELNVTGALEKWVLDKNTNKGLYLSAHAIDKPDHEVKLESIGLVNTKGDDEYQPFMVGFFHGQQIIQSHHLTRTKRSTQALKKKKKTERNIFTDESRRSEVRKSCQIQTLYVSFQDLQWHEWIIAPSGFHAYYCSGECNFPLNGVTNPTNHAIVQTLVHLMSPNKEWIIAPSGFHAYYCSGECHFPLNGVSNPTNHAIIQTLVHLTSPNKVPKPCCAPTKLGAISVLYFLDEANINLKKYKNMVVKSCGCQ